MHRLHKKTGWDNDATYIHFQQSCLEKTTFFLIKWYCWNIEWTVEPWPHSNFVQPIFCTICFLISFCKRDHVKIRKIRYHWQNAKCACQNQRNIRLTLEKENLQKITHMCSHMFCVVCFPLTKKGLHSSLLKVPLWKGSPGATAVPILILFDFVVGFSPIDGLIFWMLASKMKDYIFVGLVLRPKKCKATEMNGKHLMENVSGATCPLNKKQQKTCI